MNEFNEIPFNVAQKLMYSYIASKAANLPSRMEGELLYTMYRVSKKSQPIFQASYLNVKLITYLERGDS